MFDDAPSSHLGRGPVAVTPHHLATDAALEAMRRGGTAADAVVAANAVLGMVLPTTCGIGGDLFVMVHRPGETRPEVLNASGRAGSNADAAALRSRGLTRMPDRTPDTITVPGCVDGWEALLARHGALTLADALAPAIGLGEGGFPVSPELADDLARIEGLVAGQASAAGLYPDERPPDAGTVIHRADLASTLAAIADHGRLAFYEGRVAEAIAAATGGIVTTGDLAANQPTWVEPIGATVFGLTGWTAPPNSQGYVTLATLLLLERLAPDADPAAPHYHHAVIEAYRAVAWERADLVADPDHAPIDPERLLDPRRVLTRADAIRPDEIATWPPSPEGRGDTAYFCAIDEDGMAVSAIQSNFWGIGSGIAAGDTGVFLHNRGAGFGLEPGHPNELAAGKRPLHTLSPTLWTRDGETALVLGTRGGFQQPQYLAQMASLLLHVGLDPAEAQAMPRWHLDSDAAEASVVSVEVGMPEDVVAGLSSRGHVVDHRPEPQSWWGPVSVIAVRPDGVRHAAADPRVVTAKASGH